MVMPEKNLVYKVITDKETYAIWDEENETFIVYEADKLIPYDFEELGFVSPTTFFLPRTISPSLETNECARHCRKVTYTQPAGQGGQGWVHYDDRVPCNEKTTSQTNTELLFFLSELR